MKRIFWMLCGAGLLAPVHAQEQIPTPIQQAHWAVPSNEEVLHYELLPGGLAEAEPTPAVTVYANGLVEVSWPWYSSKAGEWQMSIPMSELQQSMAGFASNGMLTMNQQDLVAANANAREEMRSSGVLTYNSDSSVSTITMKVTNDAGVILPAEEKVLRWQGLQATAQQLNSEELDSYASIEAWLMSLAHRAAGEAQ